MVLIDSFALDKLSPRRERREDSIVQLDASSFSIKVLSGLAHGSERFLAITQSHDETLIEQSDEDSSLRNFNLQLQ